MPTQKEMEDDGCVVVAVLSAVIFSEVSSSMMLMIMTTPPKETDKERKGDPKAGPERLQTPRDRQLLLIADDDRR